MQTAVQLIPYTLLFVSLFFEVFLLVSFLERGFTGAQIFGGSQELPRVAIVVPCYNEAKTVESTLRGLPATLEVKPKQVFQSVRVALAGTTVSPGIFESAALLGKDETIRRIDAAVATPTT